MAVVSVADVENLQDIFVAMQASYTLAKEEFERNIVELDNLYTQAERDHLDAVKNLELAESNVNNCASCLEEKEYELSYAYDNLISAREGLADAESSYGYE